MSEKKEQKTEVEITVLFVESTNGKGVEEILKKAIERKHGKH